MIWEDIKVSYIDDDLVMDNFWDIWKLYLVFFNVFIFISVIKLECRDKLFCILEGEFVKVFVIFFGEYGVVKNVLEELERRLGWEWLISVKEGEILEFLFSLGFGFW